MPCTLAQLVNLTDETLQPQRFKDYCPNGLQVEGRSEVSRIVTGVTACQALLDAAIDQQADVILVHHGYFWRGESPVLTGNRLKRIKSLLDNGISLLGYHLPLDAHPEYGNNAGLANVLGFSVQGNAPSVEQDLLMLGELGEPMSGGELSTHIAACLGRPPLHIAADPLETRKLRSVAWCTGGAQGYIEKAIELGVDAYITGEVSEQTVHSARESGMHFYAAGHHATERYGVQALGAYLAAALGLEHQFIDIDNPA
ncbi:MAG: Nif3-like dinuclear metal center hexameric protein [Pseudomonadales bacterium]